MTLLLIAATLLVLIALAHSVLGERYILMRLFRRGELPRLYGSDWFTRRTLRFAWHLTSVAWLGFALLLLIEARRPKPDGALLGVVAATFLLHALVALVASRGKHFAWPVFLAIAILAWLSAPGAPAQGAEDEPCEFSIRTRAFDPSEHTLEYHTDGTTVIGIDGAAYSGSDGSIPRHEIASIALDVGRGAVALPGRAFADLFNPHPLCPEGCRVPCADSDAPSLTLLGGDAAGAFTAELQLDLAAGTLERRLFEHPDPETPVSTTYLLSPEAD